MTVLSLVLCEGPHDQAILVGLARRCGAWNLYDGARSGLPNPFDAAYPEHSRNRKGWPTLQPTPAFIHKDDRWVEIRPLEGIDSTLGKQGARLLQSRLDDPLRAFGVLVDANEAGVGDRVSRFEATYGPLIDGFKSAAPGTVVDSPVRHGLWVAPDNNDNGTLTDMLLAAANRERPDLTAAAAAFVDSNAAHGVGPLPKHRAKAIGGSAAQLDIPGASLATALIKHHEEWFSASLAGTEPFASLLGFLDALTAP